MVKTSPEIAPTLYHFPQFPLDSGKELVGLGAAVVGCVIGMFTVGVEAIKAPPGGLRIKVSTDA
jgi:hypothetical protein